MTIIFPVGLVSKTMIFTLRNDYAKYSHEVDDLETLERDGSEGACWKCVHGDVF